MTDQPADVSKHPFRRSMYHPEAVQHWTVAASEQGQVSERLTACWSLMEFGAFEPTARLLAQLPQSGPRDELLDVCQAVAAAGPLYPERPNSMTADIAVSARPGAEDVLIVFSGDGPRFMVLPPLFSRPDLHVVLLRNGERHAFFRSLYGLGDNLEGNVAALRRLAGRLGARRVHMLGMSVGGTAALRFGLAMEADTVTCFSAIPQMLPGEDEEIDRHPAMLSFMKIASPELIALLDVPRNYREAAVRPRTRMYFGEGCETDRKRAMRLEGLAEVSMHPVAGVDDHHCLGAVCSSGQIHPILAEVLGT